MRGIGGRLLEVDLTNGKVKDLPVSDGMFEKYLGGRGVGARLLFDRLPAKTDPLSPENFLIFLTGPLTGNLAPGSSKFVVVTKSPLTQGWCDTYSSGRMAVELKRIGYDGIIVTGKANHPCYLKIDDEGVRIKEADFIWGKDSFETERLLKEREKCESLRVVSIGPAGERLCKYASINSDLYRQAGRGGAGAVMGSKNLKAVAVRGTGGIKSHDRHRVVELNREFYRRAQKSEVARTRRKYGTPLTLNITNAGGSFRLRISGLERGRRPSRRLTQRPSIASPFRTRRVSIVLPRAA
jgi:aldehyde:ferredoxin oxidoreductase